MSAVRKAQQARQIRQKTLAVHKGPSRQGWAMLLVLSVVGLGFMPHLSMVLLAGMIPSIVAAGVTSGLVKGSRVYTLATFNLAGVLPFLFDMTWGAQQSVSAGVILADIYVWFLMYAAAAFGALVNWMAPVVAAIILTQRNRDQARALGRVRQSLIDEWGGEVAGQLMPASAAAARGPGS